jgi:hypothetical protein
MFAMLVVVAAVLVGCSTDVAEPASEAAIGTATVEIVQDGETQTFLVEGVAEGETVESVMRKVDGVEISISGSGNLAFLEQIGDQATESGEGWTYTIDGQRVERGIGATKVTVPTTITWTYGEY